MPAPALKIPVQVDLDALKKQMDAGADHVGRAAKFMGEQFQRLNSTIVTGGGSAAAAYATGFAGAALRIVGSFALIYGAAKVLGAIIDQTREQLAQLVDVANKARDRGVGPGFFQGFTAEAERLQIKVEDLEGALTNAFNATKEKPPIDLEKWDTGEDKINDVERALRIYNVTLAKAQGQTLQGLVLFREASTQEEKVRAVLEAMVQLEKIGQRTAALDVGEKMFGAQFVERIRQGRTSAQQLLETVDRIQRTSGQAFSDEMINRAKDVDDKLKEAHNTLDKNLRPTWQGIAAITVEIKDLWADIIKLIAQVVEIVPSSWLPKDDLAQAKDQLKLINSEIKQLEAAGEGMGDTAKNLREIKEGIENALRLQGRGVPITVTASGTGPAPTRKPEGTEDENEGLDALERAILLTEKHIAVLDAETSAIDKGSAAKARAKAVEELRAAAIRANIDAGEEDTRVTAAQEIRIQALADKLALVAKRAEEARLPLREFAREAGDGMKNIQTVAVNGLKSFEDALIDIGKGAKTAEQAFKDMAASILEDIARMLIRMQITIPIAMALNAALTGSTGGVLPGGLPLGQGGIGHNALGTQNWRGGATWVGENGPELVNLPRGSQVIPNSVARSGGVGGVTVNFAPVYNVNGSGPEIAQLRAQMAADKREVPRMAVEAVREARGRKIA